MRVVYRIIGAAFFLLCAVFGFTFTEILMNQHEDFGDAITRAGLPLLTVVTGIVGLFFWIRGTEFEKRSKTFETLLIIGTIVYAACLIGTVFGTADRTRINGGVHTFSLVPFRTIREYLGGCSEGRISAANAWLNIIGNLVLFCPVGFIAPYFVEFLRRKTAFFAALFAVLWSVELFQFVTGRGYMDIDDVILNFIGAAIVFLLTWNSRAEQLWEKAGIIDESLYY